MTNPQDKLNEGRAFFWQDVERVNAIRSFVPHRKLAPILALYNVLAEIANGQRVRRFETYHSSLCTLSGLSPLTVRIALRVLEVLCLIVVTTPTRAGAGRYAPIHIELTKGRYQATPSIRGAVLDALSAPLRSPLSANNVNSRGSLRNIKLEAETKDPLTPKTTEVEEIPEETTFDLGISERVRTVVLSFAPSVKKYQENPHKAIACATRLSNDYGEDATYRALLWAIEKGVDDPLAYISKVLRDHDSTESYPWANSSPHSGAPPPPTDPMTAWLTTQPMYRELTGVQSRSVQETKMRRMVKENAPDLEIDVTTIQPDDFLLSLYRHRGLVIPTTTDTPSS